MGTKTGTAPCACPAQLWLKSNPSLSEGLRRQVDAAAALVGLVLGHRPRLPSVSGTAAWRQAGGTDGARGGGGTEAIGSNQEEKAYL